PPKKYGWDAIDNDVMVNVKGAAAVVAAVLLLAAALFRPFRELRVQSRALRAIPVVLLVAAGLASVWLGGLADIGTTPVEWAKWAREQGASVWYGAAAASVVLALALLTFLLARRKAPVLGAIGVTLLMFNAAIDLWLGGLNVKPDQLVDVVKWAKDHGSAPGFY